MTCFQDKPVCSSASSGQRIATTCVVALLALATSGCGVLAAPCRISSAVIKMVPVVGHAAALPTDACAAVIDP